MLVGNKLNKETNNISVPSTLSTSAIVAQVHVEEFKPTSPGDPTLLTLRNLFVRSFAEFYKQIEADLKLKSGKNLIQWLDETFDGEQEALLKREYRCFVLCTNENINSNDSILGFLTLKEEDQGSIYIAQVAVRLGIKRLGYGIQLLRHLLNIYPPNTYYWGLCRRVNRPALQFYLKIGAKFMTDDDIAIKYKYDPELYAGFEFTSTVS